jgi:hypothetical protein
MVRLSQSAFLIRCQLIFFSLLDRLFVAFQRPSGKTLASPTKLTQDAPDVVLVVSHPGSVLDEFPHPIRGPSPFCYSKASGPRLSALDPAQLRRLSFAGRPVRPPCARRALQIVQAPASSKHR